MTAGARPPVQAASGRRPALAALILVTCVGPFAVDTYLSALPAMRRSLHTSPATVQLTITAFIVGIALGQVLIGPRSDAGGRRGYLLGSAAAFLVASLACALAPTAPVLVAARLVQGLAAGAGVACGRAVVSDSYQGEAAAKRLGTLASINFLGPVLAPTFGSLLLAHGSWRLIFVILTGVGAVMLTGVVVGIPETLPAPQRQAQGLAATGTRMADLLGEARYRRHIVVSGLATAGFFTYIGGSSFVLETMYHLSQRGYALLFAVNATAMVSASVAFRLLVGRFGAARLRLAGLAVATAAAVALLAVALRGVTGAGPPPLAVPWALLCGLTAGMGLVQPASMVLAQEAGQRSRGTAAALQGGLSFLAGALVTPLTGVLGYHTLVPMAALMTGFLLAALLGLIRSP